MIYALDTNIITAMLKDDEAVNDKADLVTNNGHELNIPPIVDYEIRRGLLAQKLEKTLRKFDRLEQSIDIGEFNLRVWRKAAQIYAELRKKGKPIGDDETGLNNGDS